MASTTQYLRDIKQGSVVVKIEGDAADSTTLSAASVTGLPEDGTATIQKIMWTVESGQITITWDGVTDKVACRLSGNGYWNMIQSQLPITNNAATPSGDIVIAKTGATDYTIIVEFGTGAYQNAAAI
jgi:hypothetical protein|tara:strand:- start:1043 stop:1423 length:381 start_codon:yes stop_codon:yes gene_type:complete